MGAFISELDELNTPTEPTTKITLTEPVESKYKIATNPRTDILLKKLDLFLKDNTDPDNIKEINDLKAAINSIRINSIELAAKLGVVTGKALIALDDYATSPQSYKACMQDLLEIKLDTIIESLLDTVIEGNYLSRDLFNFYANLLKRMQSNFRLVEVVYDKNSDPRISNIDVLLAKLNTSIANIVNSVY